VFKFKNNSFGLVGFMLAILTLSFGVNVSYAAPTTTGQPTGNVNVVNTPNVNVANQPTVGLAPGSNVGISGNPGVTITNPSSSPIPFTDTDNPARHPFVARCEADLPDGQDFGACRISAQQGVRSVLEVESAAALLPTGQRASVKIGITTNGSGPLTFALPLSLQMTSSGLDFFGTTTSARLYPDPGTDTLLEVSRPVGAAGSAHLELRVSGYTLTP